MKKWEIGTVEWQIFRKMERVSKDEILSIKTEEFMTLLLLMANYGQLNTALALETSLSKMPRLSKVFQLSERLSALRKEMPTLIKALEEDLAHKALRNHLVTVWRGIVSDSYVQSYYSREDIVAKP